MKVALRIVLLVSLLAAAALGCVGDEATNVTYSGARYFGVEAESYELSAVELRRIGVVDAAVPEDLVGAAVFSMAGIDPSRVIVVRSDYAGVEQDMVFWRERIEYPQELCPFVRDGEPLPETCRDR
jgi:hypothetical protein